MKDRRAGTRSVIWRRAAIVGAAVACSVLALTSAAPVDQPRVRLIATGGSISQRDGGRLTASELIRGIPGLNRYANVEPEQFRNVSSSQLTLDDWLELARLVNDVLDTDSGLSGVVITTGTDTLEEIAYFLHLSVRSRRPVVMVGSMRTPDSPGYDGDANLLAAIRTAVEPEAVGHGVLVVTNDEINSAREVAKTDALRLQTFQSGGYGRLGVVDPDRVLFYRSPVKRHSADSEFDVRAIKTLPRVDIVMFYQGASGDVIRAVVDQGTRGLVVAVPGADISGGTMGPAIAQAASQGIPVVLSTRTGSGRIAAPGGPLWPASQVAAGTVRALIAAEDLPPLKARVLLMLALTRTSDPREIQRIFQEY